ncbi:lysozyme inhibitor LprI family protein [Sebaldella termitidis]|uniref:lysozyme inhibitor LprI family protein n=1 Tax=Sebaldella termitidis TaxID=826 RepID=UPI003EB89C38
MKKFILFLVFTLAVSSFANYENDLLGRMKTVEQKSGSMLDSAQTTAEMINAVSYASNEWDTELNKIYKLLMSSLSKDGQNSLRNAQRSWIKERDKKIAGENSGGTIDLVNKSSIFLEETKKRTIELARIYDKLKSKT